MDLCLKYCVFMFLTLSAVVICVNSEEVSCYSCRYTEVKCTGGDVCATYEGITGNIECYNMTDQSNVAKVNKTGGCDKGCHKLQTYYTYKVRIENAEYQFKVNITTRGCSEYVDPGCAYNMDLYNKYIKPNIYLVYPGSYSGTCEGAGCTCKDDLCNTGSRPMMTSSLVLAVCALAFTYIFHAEN